MLRLIGVFAAAAGLGVPAGADATQFSLADDAKAFGARENVRSVEISPSGSKLLFIAAGAGRLSALQYVDISTKAARTLLASDGDPEELFWCRFGSDTQLVCKYGGLLAMEGSLVGFSRLVTLSSGGGKPSQLGTRENYYNQVVRQSDGEILDWLPNRPGAVLVARGYSAERFRSGSNIRDTREGVGVDRIDLATLKSSTVIQPRPDADTYITDGLGSVRIMEIANITGERQDLTGITRYKFQRIGSHGWEPLTEFDVRNKKGSYPVAVEAESDSAFVIGRLNGRDALYRLKLDGSRTSNLVAANDTVDIDGVVRVGRGQRIIGYTYATEGRNVVYFDSEFKKLEASLSAALPGRPAINFEGASADGTKIVVRTSSDTDPGTYYLFDKATKRLDEIAPARTELEGRKLAQVKPVRIPAADGALIPGYVTLPPQGLSKKLPAVVLPHGGPSARDEGGFDWLAQFLAARGYAVIQPNYRGSTGYGDNWEGANGFKDWEKAIADISVSARYLVQQGIADPDRLAIVGWSYGGYAALQSAAVEPGLYKAAVAIAPVADLSLLKAQSENFTNRLIVEQFVGSGAHVAAGSPVLRAKSIVAPVLLVHGDLDANVGIQHSEKMAAALKEAGRRVELIRFKGLDHQLEDSGARAQMLTRIGQFLDAAIGH